MQDPEKDLHKALGKCSGFPSLTQPLFTSMVHFVLSRLSMSSQVGFWLRLVTALESEIFKCIFVGWGIKWGKFMRCYLDAHLWSVGRLYWDIQANLVKCTFGNLNMLIVLTTLTENSDVFKKECSYVNVRLYTTWRCLWIHGRNCLLLVRWKHAI